MKLCKFQGCAVCQQIEQRRIFKSILEERCPDVYICADASCGLITTKGKTVVFSLNSINEEQNGKFYIKDIFTGNPIYLNKDNFRVICTREKRNCRKKPYTFEV